MNTLDLARTAARKAIEIRRQAAVLRTDPVNVYDMAMEKFGVRVQFLAGSSFEGMFAKEQGTILVPLERPPGRRMFAAGHELGHWAFGHGSQIDGSETIDSYSCSPEERLVNLFAGHLLMSPPAIEMAASQLALRFSEPDRYKLYEMSSWFGVGYSTLVNHLSFGQPRISPTAGAELLRYQPKEIRRALVPGCTTRHLVVAQSMNPRIPIDLAVGDHAIFPGGTMVSERHLAQIASGPDKVIVQALKPGISLANNANGWAGVIRIMKSDFTGWAKYRHMDDDDLD